MRREIVFFNQLGFDISNNKGDLGIGFIRVVPQPRDVMPDTQGQSDRDAIKIDPKLQPQLPALDGSNN